MKLWTVASLPRERYHEFLKAADLSAGIYRIAKGAEDAQKPHTEDEVYFVLAGRARFTAGHETVSVKPGDILYVKAKEKHHFHDVEDDLALLVVFGPAQGARAAGTT